MTIFGKKFDSGITRFANKVKHADFNKIGQKIGNGIHKGLDVASKVVNFADNVAEKVVNYSGKLEGVPFIGAAAGVVNVAAKQARNITRSAKAGVDTLGRITDTGAKAFGDTANRIKNKGVEGLEKRVKQGLDASRQVQNFGDTIGRARSAIVKSGFNADVVGEQVRNVVAANPLANKK
jgi:hypothetical protein